MPRRLHRYLGIVGLAGRRVIGRFSTSPQRVVLTVLGVAVAVGLLISITGISLGLASESVIQSEGVDYWIVPEDSTVSSIAVSTGSVQLGSAHTISEQLRTDERVQYATPVLLELLPVTDTETGERDYVMAVGIIPSETQGEFSGIATRGLTPGDPYYANGSYNGTWTGDVVVNTAAATLLNASQGETIETPQQSTNRTLTVRQTASGGLGVGGGTTPVMLVHLSELQSITGATSGDHADQVLVSTDDPTVKSELENLYPQTTVVTKSGVSAQDVSLSNLPFAIAIAALGIGIVVGVLFVATLMGLEVSASEQELAILGAMGYAKWRRMALIAVESLVTSLLGGVLGCGVGVGGIYLINSVIAPRVGLETVARFEPFLLGYAFAVAVVIGLLGMIYPVLLGRRTDLVEVLAR